LIVLKQKDKAAQIAPNPFINKALLHKTPKKWGDCGRRFWSKMIENGRLTKKTTLEDGSIITILRR